jgi:hypothetical protein
VSAGARQMPSAADSMALACPVIGIYMRQPITRRDTYLVIQSQGGIHTLPSSNALSGGFYGDGALIDELDELRAPHCSGTR